MEKENKIFMTLFCVKIIKIIRKQISRAKLREPEGHRNRT